MIEYIPTKEEQNNPVITIHTEVISNDLDLLADNGDDNDNVSCDNLFGYND